MRQARGSLSVTAPRAGLHEITSSVERWVRDQRIASGLLTLLIRHTSASLLIHENAASAAQRDTQAFFALIAPESAAYEHDDEGPDDMPAHLRTALTQTSLSVPVAGGRMLLGTGQGIFLFEHRRMPTPREIVLHLIGEGDE
jgi:secondary thiamine-phosphate synthase enzyme